VWMLIDRGADLHVADGKGCTPLHAACGFGCHGSVVRLLNDR
jgi:hypothetical protein